MNTFVLPWLNFKNVTSRSLNWIDFWEFKNDNRIGSRSWIDACLCTPPLAWHFQLFRSRNRFSSQIAHSQSFAKAIEPHVSQYEDCWSVTQPWQLETTPKAAPRQWFRLRLNLKGIVPSSQTAQSIAIRYTPSQTCPDDLWKIWKSQKYTQALSDAPVLTNMLHNSRSQRLGPLGTQAQGWTLAKANVVLVHQASSKLRLPGSQRAFLWFVRCDAFTCSYCSWVFEWYLTYLIES